jgi:hypothetical protein
VILSPEDNLLCFCARIHIDEDTKNRIAETLNLNLNWDYIVQKAKGQGVAPLLYHHLSKNRGGSQPPAEIIATLRKVYERNIGRNMLLYQTLNQILKTFKEESIQVIVLKGAFLAETIYPNIALRPMFDIDLLIRPEDLARVRQLIEDLGYHHCLVEGKLLDEAFIGRSAYLKQFMLHIHWTLVNVERYKRVTSIDVEAMWRRAKPVKIAGSEAKTLSPEDMLLYLCLHLSIHHVFSGLIRFCDIREVIKFYDGQIDWERLTINAQRFKLQRPIYYALYYTKELLGTPIPQDVLTELKPLKTNHWETKIIELNMEFPIKNFVYISPLFLIDGLGNKLRFLRGSIFSKGKFKLTNRSPLKSRGGYLKYLVRSLRLSLKAMRALIYIGQRLIKTTFKSPLVGKRYPLT